MPPLSPCPFSHTMSCNIFKIPTQNSSLEESFYDRSFQVNPFSWMTQDDPLRLSNAWFPWIHFPLLRFCAFSSSACPRSWGFPGEEAVFSASSLGDQDWLSRTQQEGDSDASSCTIVGKWGPFLRHFKQSTNRCATSAHQSALSCFKTEAITKENGSIVSTCPEESIESIALCTVNFPTAFLF